MNPENEVSKTFVVKRLITSDLPGCWTTFKGDLWTAPTLSQIIANSGSATSKQIDKVGHPISFCSTQIRGYPVSYRVPLASSVTQ